MDQDGANPQLPDRRRLHRPLAALLADEQAITYMSYERTTPSVFVFDLQTGQREVIGQYAGMTFAPRFAPDGNRVDLQLFARQQRRRLHRRSALAPARAPDATTRASTPRRPSRPTARASSSTPIAAARPSFT